MAATAPDREPGKIDCLGCTHFQVTWDPDHPRACRAMGFKGKAWPCLEVLHTSGERCLLYQPKPRPDADGHGRQAKPGEEPATPPGRFSRRV